MLLFTLFVKTYVKILTLILKQTTYFSMDPINHNSPNLQIRPEDNTNKNEGFFRRVWNNFVNLLHWPSSTFVHQNKSAEKREAVSSTSGDSWKSLNKETRLAWAAFSKLTSDEKVEEFYEKLQNKKTNSVTLTNFKKLVTALHNKDYRKAAHIYMLFFQADKDRALANKFLLGKLKDKLTNEIKQQH